jgi:hypothetical protein
MAETQRANWVDIYQAALLETDPERFSQLWREAYQVVEQREHELLQSGDGHGEEMKAVADALRNLRVLAGEAA